MEKLYNTYKRILFESNNNGYVAYHGSDKPINQFTDEFISDDNINASGPGIYCTNSIQDAMQWGTYIHKLILRPRKVISNEVSSEKVNRKDLMKLLNNVEDYSSNWHEDIETDKMMAIQAAIKHSTTEDDVFHTLRNEQFNYQLQTFMRAMTNLGYDMLKLKKDFTSLTDVKVPYHYIVYNPAIINIIDVNKINVE